MLSAITLVFILGSFVLLFPGGSGINRNIEIISSSACDYDKSSGYEISMTPRTQSGRLILDLDATLPENIDDSMEFLIEVSKLVGKSYVNNIISLREKFCNAITKEFKKLWMTLANNSNPKAASTCPIKAGKYTLRNFAIGQSDVPIPLIKGQFKIKLSGVKGGNTIFCENWEFLVS